MDRRMDVATISVLMMLLSLGSANSLSQDKNATSVNVTTVGAHYKSNSELEVALKNFTQRCHHISRLYSIGNSTLGVPLWALEISDNPGVLEPKPAFKYVGNIHGDEPLGRELVLLLADWLCDNYLKDAMATLIVDKIHLHLLPSMNPDGFAAETGPTRNNAHDIDLNRDFPDQVLLELNYSSLFVCVLAVPNLVHNNVGLQFFPQNNNEDKRQAETRAIMNWIRSIRFTASASFHEGALVANFPYDGNREISNKYAVSPDDSTFKYLAGVYASNHPLMSKSKEFIGGVTNGAAWYPLYGGMQDWNYLHGDCLELTLEMNENKWPPPIQVPQIWREHRKSMLELIAATATSGVHGRVMSSREGQPLEALISVSGISHSIKASAEFGDYHRLLAPGQVYEVTASLMGYSSRTTYVFLPNRTATMLDFILDPLSEDGAPVKESAAEVVHRKPSNISRKELSVEEVSWLGSSTQLSLVYLVPIVSVAAAVVFLLLRSRGSFRFFAARQRLSRV